MGAEFLERSMKRLLASVYALGLEKGVVTLRLLAERMGIEEPDLTLLVSNAIRHGLLRNEEDRLELSHEGRSRIKVVMAGGVFDIIHPGHLYTLEKSKSLGDVLVVSVARDVTARKSRGDALINDEETRRRLVASLRCVDTAILGSEKDIFETVVRVSPDIIALGYDQKHDEGQIRDEARRRGVITKVVRLDSPRPELKSSEIKRKPEELHSL